MAVRRALAAVLAVCLLLAVMPAALAAGTTGLSVTATQSDDGATVTATVHVTPTEALAGLQFTLNYDSSLMSVTGEPVVGGAAAQMSYICNPNAESAVVLAAISANGVANTGGSLLTVKFAVKAGASGKASFQLTECQLLNNDVKEISSAKPAEVSVTLKTPANAAAITKPDVVTSPDVEKSDQDNSGSENAQSNLASSFIDCRGHWADSYIAKAAEAGYINGMGGGKYMPDANMTRAQFVTILWRYAGSPEPSAAAPFTDLSKSQTWYSKAVAWAAEKGIVNGIGAGKFGPDGYMTREQMVTILFRYSGRQPGIEQGLYAGAFRDEKQISAWAKTALWWAIYNDLYCGVGAVSTGDTLAPTARATRAQIAVVMVKFAAALAK